MSLKGLSVMAIVHRLLNTEASALGVAAVVEGHTDYDYTPGPNGEHLDPMHFVLGPRAQGVTLMSPGDYVVELEQPRRVVIVPAEAFEALKSFEVQNEEGVHKLEAQVIADARSIEAADFEAKRLDLAERYARADARADVRSGYADPRFRKRQR